MPTSGPTITSRVCAAGASRTSRHRLPNRSRERFQNVWRLAPVSRSRITGSRSSVVAGSARRGGALGWPDVVRRRMAVPDQKGKADMPDKNPTDKKNPTASVSESENPAIPSPTPKRTRPRSNRDWWPDQLELSVLRAHSPRSSPMGADFNYAKELKTLDVEALK